MSDNTPQTQKVLPLPDTMKIKQAIAMLDDLDVEIKYLKKLQKETGDQLRSMIQQVNKMRLMLEAK